MTDRDRNDASRDNDDPVQDAIEGTFPKSEQSEHSEGTSPAASFAPGHRELPKLAPGLEPGDLIGDFRLVRLIGQGGMGHVWEARQLSLGGRKVAIKFIHPERTSALNLQLFRREARAGGRLSHPGIVTVHGHGEEGELAWIAMEYVEGNWTLRDSIDEIAKLDRLPDGYDRETARLVAEIADALQSAHAAGVIHRDLKPQNILITQDQRPRVTDFGLAKITDEAALSQTGDFAGTYLYMSPEQVAARRMGIDHRTDVFSLGVVLYEMLALRRPFDGDTSQQVATQILTRDPPDLRTIRSRVPTDLVIIAGKSLEKDPDRRYQTMSELAGDLRRYLVDEPIHARPPSRWQQAIKWSRRNPTKSAAGAVATVAFVAISILLAENARARAELSEANASLAEEIRAVKRLSAMEILGDLLAEADDQERMWPAYPERIPAYRTWILRAEELLEDLPEYRAKRAELRAHARPRTAEERRRQREDHADYARLLGLQDELAQQRRALARRSGDELIGRPKLLTIASAAQAPARMQQAEALLAEGLDDDALDAGYEALEAAAEGELEELEQRYESLERRVAVASTAEGQALATQEIAALQQQHGELERLVDEPSVWHFPADQTDARWWHAQLSKLLERLEGLSDEASGLLAREGVSPEHAWSVPRRLAFAEELQIALAPGGDYDNRWQGALPKIKEAYPGLELSIQIGLVPIGMDPKSGLWEFWHVQSGTEPVRDETHRLQLTGQTGLVFVLIPREAFLMGAQSTDPDGQNYSERALENESPVHEVEISPFLLSKYEMTQGQWLRVSGVNPSLRRIPRSRPPVDKQQAPVENVTWSRCRVVLGRSGLTLPSEAQWERACRAGTSTPHSCRERELATHANLLDLTRKDLIPGTGDTEEWHDGSVGRARVGTFLPNALGLHDMHGNVYEWCLDGHDQQFYRHSPRLDPLASWQASPHRVIRGGYYNGGADQARSSFRFAQTPSFAGDFLGVRPAMHIR